MSARPYPGRPANDNFATLDVTSITLRVFGPTLVASLLASTVWLVSVW